MGLWHLHSPRKQRVGGYLQRQRFGKPERTGMLEEVRPDRKNALSASLSSKITQLPPLVASPSATVSTPQSGSISALAVELRTGMSLGPAVG
jgi:hypothetical protein